eukprot:COSAG04_NODE_1545_length_6408_cov_2.554288_7_plen_65_part_00
MAAEEPELRTPGRRLSLGTEEPEREDTEPEHTELWPLRAVHITDGITDGNRDISSIYPPVRGRI